MSISLTRILQQITGLNTFFAGPSASRDNGVVLLDTATVTWGTDGQGNIQATAAGGSAPTGAANLVYATPNGSSGSASLRALVTADLPALPPSGLTLIQTQVLVTAEATVTFSGIPQTFTHLQLIDTCANSSSIETYQLTLNADAGADYSNAYVLNSAGSGPTANFTASQTSGNLGTVDTVQSSHVVNFIAYSASLNKVWFSKSFGAGTFDQQDTTGIWTLTAPITSITLSCAGSTTFKAGSIFSLYGLQ